MGVWESLLCEPRGFRVESGPLRAPVPAPERCRWWGRWPARRAAPLGAVGLLSHAWSSARAAPAGLLESRTDGLVSAMMGSSTNFEFLMFPLTFVDVGFLFGTEAHRAGQLPTRSALLTTPVRGTHTAHARTIWGSISPLSRLTRNLTPEAGATSASVCGGRALSRGSECVSAGGVARNSTRREPAPKHHRSFPLRSSPVPGFRLLL